MYITFFLSLASSITFLNGLIFYVSVALFHLYNRKICTGSHAVRFLLFSCAFWRKHVQSLQKKSKTVLFKVYNFEILKFYFLLYLNPLWFHNYILSMFTYRERWLRCRWLGHSCCYICLFIYWWKYLKILFRVIL